MILSDFLSWQLNDDSNSQEIIPISFNMCQVLDDNYYNKNIYFRRVSCPKHIKDWTNHFFKSQKNWGTS